MKKSALEEVLNKKLNIALNILNVKMDTRLVEDNDIFVGINNGNNYIETALENGAAFVICENKRYINHEKVAVVEDSIEFMQKWAKIYLEKLDILTIAVTGSNGKTSTKDIIYSYLSKFKNGIKTMGNYNNNIGLPFTVLQLEEKHEFAVLEMGMSNFGEIDLLGEIVKPEISCITNIGDSHLEFLKNREGVFKAKSEILKHTKNKVIINGDDVFLDSLDGIKIGFNKKNDYIINKYKEFDDGMEFYIFKEKNIKFITNLNGKHNLYNITMAIAVLNQLGYKLEDLLEESKNLLLTGMRFEKIDKDNLIFINDAYNSSPVSVKCALESFDNIYKDRAKVIVIGDMLELGEKSREFHREVSSTLRKIKFDFLYLYGKEVEAIYDEMKEYKNVYYFSDKKLIQKKIYEIKNPAAVLLKGSRGMKLEEII